ncbi:MAG TPA: glycoside hydrolase family 71/99-like protein [Puia sp.]|nr:glycoside hydrolase family 71/99-like protein [Puia sp.]
MFKRQVLLLTGNFLIVIAFAQHKHSPSSSFMSYQGLVMAGYQGWFNAPADGANMGWNHYATHGRFEPGYCKVDFWPDVSEYQKTYETPFRLADGSPAYIFSSYDSQTVALHFKWMKDYGLDGVFIQRSVTAIKNPENLRDDDWILNNSLAASQRFHRAIAIQYDFSGLNDDNNDWQLIINDWKHLVDSLHIAGRGDQQTYLYHHGRPLVGFWGVGFPDRSNNLKTTEKLINFFKNDPVYGGCSILLGVPAYWRDFGKDTEKDTFLHELLRKADIVRPWFVGRFDEQTYPEFKDRIRADIAWCSQNRLDYVPVVFPGFSWHNMHPDSHQAQIPRNRGRFYWQQLAGAIEEGAEMIYIAMFDEMDEGTAIFKMTNNPPSGLSKFERFESDIPADYYLFLTGVAAGMLKKQIPFQTSIPLRPPR